MSCFDGMTHLFSPSTCFFLVTFCWDSRNHIFGSCAKNIQQREREQEYVGDSSHCHFSHILFPYLLSNIWLCFFFEEMLYYLFMINLSATLELVTFAHARTLKWWRGASSEWLALSDGSEPVASTILTIGLCHHSMEQPMSLFLSVKWLAMEDPRRNSLFLSPFMWRSWQIIADCHLCLLWACNYWHDFLQVHLVLYGRFLFFSLLELRVWEFCDIRLF